jgi:phosphoadenosine phosphosulfate reductase
MSAPQRLQSKEPSVNELASSLTGLDAAERIRLLDSTYPGKVIASTSFGLQAGVMLQHLAEHAPHIPIVFIDTGYLFPETYRYAVELTERLNLDLKIYRPQWSPAWQEAIHGKLWEQGSQGYEAYSLMNKVEPMNRAITELGARIWLSGLRRSHSKTRVDRPFAEQQSKTIKAYPILDWSDEQVADFMARHDLPQHPLREEYSTMGDWHSTAKRSAADSDEDTRFNGEKYECGLHLNSGVTDYQI